MYAKQPPRTKKHPVVETRSVSEAISSTLSTQIAQIAAKTDTDNSVRSSTYVDSLGDMITLTMYADGRTVMESELSEANAEYLSLLYDNVSFEDEKEHTGITRVRTPKISNATDVCIITLGEYTKYIKGKYDFISQTRLYFEKHNGFLPEGFKQHEKDVSGNTSYYSQLSCSSENIDKLKQIIKTTINAAKVKWL